LVVLAAGCGGSHTAAAPPATAAKKVAAPPSFADVVASVRSGVIRIETTTCDGEAVGTGILLTPRLIATVDHVVDGATSIALKRDGKVVGRGTVIGTDSARDVALIRSDQPIVGHRFKLASRAPRLGEDVAAIGFPLALPLTVTRGSVSGLGRTIPIDGINRTRLVQTDAAVNRGNSGGPLMTDSGLVVGLVDLGTTEANGLAFAVGAQTAGPLLTAWASAPQPVSATTCSGGSSQQAAAPPATQTTSSGASWTSFSGGYFSIAYPDTWVVEAAEQSKGSYLDTTITSPVDTSVLIRVDVSPGANSSDPVTASAPVVRQLRRETGYQEIQYRRFTFNGYDAVDWEFLVPEGGMLMHKEEVAFTSARGDDFGVLVQAPDSEYSALAAFFTDVFNSLTVN
jgi:S1-C subfamily serine protease